MIFVKRVLSLISSFYPPGKEKGRENFLRRLIRLIYADWLPHDNRFIGSCLCLNARISPKTALKLFRGFSFINGFSLPIALPEEISFLIFVIYAVCPTIIPQINPENSLATAVTAVCNVFPRTSNLKNFLCNLFNARSAYAMNSAG